MSGKVRKTLRLDPELVERLEAWIMSQRVAPAENSVVEVAITEFLDREMTDYDAMAKKGAKKSTKPKR